MHQQLARSSRFFWLVSIAFSASLVAILFLGLPRVDAQTAAYGPATELFPGRPVTSMLGFGDRRLDDGAYYRLYRFSAAAGQLVRITMNSDDFDAYLLLLDAYGNILATDDDSGSGTNARITYTIPHTGDFLVIAKSYWRTGEGWYTLSLEFVDNSVPPVSDERVLSFGRSITARLGPQDDVLVDGTYAKRYTFFGTAGHRVRITMRSTEFNAYLILLDPNGEFLAGDNDSGGGTDAMIEIRLPSTGTYTVFANAYRPGEQGRFTIRLDSQESGGGGTGTNRISLGQTVTGTLTLGDERLSDGSYVKRYVFDGTAGQRVIITLRSSDFDAYLWLHNEANQLLTFDDDSAGGTNARIEFVLPYTGTYEIVVNSYWAGETGQFTLTLETPGGNPQPDSPRRVQWGQTIYGTLGPGDEKLWDGTYAKRYIVFGRAGDEVRITLRSNDFDAYLYLIDSRGFYVAVDNNSGGGKDAQIRVRIPADGEYEVVANSLFAGETGAFTLTLENLSTPPHQDGETSWIRLGETVQGRLQGADPRLDDGSHYHTYLFEGAAGQRVRLRLNSSDFDAFLVLGDLDGVVLAVDDDSGGGWNAMLEAVLPRTDTYVIVVSSYWSNEVGRYTLETEITNGAGPAVPGNFAGELRSGVRTPAVIPGNALFQFWRIQVPPGTRYVEVRLYEAEGQLDLVAAPGTRLSTNLHDYPHQALTGRENERLVFSPGPGETVFTVGVINWTFSDLRYHIEVAFDRPLPPATVYTPPLTNFSLLTPLQRAIRATVHIQTDVGMGSGTILTPDGVILTNYHVIAECEIYGVFSCAGDLLRRPDGSEMELIIGLSDETLGYAVQYFVARPLRWLPEYDLALIEIVSDLDGNPVRNLQLPTVPIDLSLSPVQLGDEVIAIGYPTIAQVSTRVPLTLTRGIVSGYTQVGGQRVFIHTDAEINRGNSGGALITADTGVLVGIPSSGRVDSSAGEKSNFARSLNLLPQEWISLLRARGAEFVSTGAPILR